MPLDINVFREEKQAADGAVDWLAKVRASHAARGKPATEIDAIIAVDHEWRQALFAAEQARKKKGQCSKQMPELMKAGKKEEAERVRAESKALDEEIKLLSSTAEAAERQKLKLVGGIGNFVHESVPVSRDEKDNKTVYLHGTPTVPCAKVLHHHELLWMIDGYEPARGAAIAGHRGYFLKGAAVLLNQALINYGIQFLMKKEYTPIQPPFFMRKEVMAETAQLEEFDEALYKVTGEEEKEPFYLIATSEQPISALHRGEWLAPASLPIRYAGVSSCFRKEAGAHGRDTWGIFRIHQFEKVEQFVLAAPDKSWEMLEEMIGSSQEFYAGLGLHFRVVSIVSGALNNAAAKKYDLEAWFPAFGVFRELVSCSNCTDYQSRAMGIRYGETKKAGENTYVHLLNATLTATERTICCILENYQTPTGINVPEVLQPFMGGMKFIPFKEGKGLDTVPNAVSVVEGKEAKEGKGEAKDGKEEAKEGKGAKKEGGKGKKEPKPKQEKKGETKTEAPPAAAATEAAPATPTPAATATATEDAPKEEAKKGKGGKGKQEAKKGGKGGKPEAAAATTESEAAPVTVTAPVAAVAVPAATPEPTTEAAAPEPKKGKGGKGKQEAKKDAKKDDEKAAAATAATTAAPVAAETPKEEAKKDEPKKGKGKKEAKKEEEKPTPAPTPAPATVAAAAAAPVEEAPKETGKKGKGGKGKQEAKKEEEKPAPAPTPAPTAAATATPAPVEEAKAETPKKGKKESGGAATTPKVEGAGAPPPASPGKKPKAEPKAEAKKPDTPKGKKGKKGN